MEIVWASMLPASVDQVWPCCSLHKGLKSVLVNCSEWALIRELDKRGAVLACSRAWSFWFVPC